MYGTSRKFRTLILHVLVPGRYLSRQFSVDTIASCLCKYRITNIRVKLDTNTGTWSQILASTMKQKLQYILLFCSDRKPATLKNWPVMRLCTRCLSVWGPQNPVHPPLHTVYEYLYSILIHTGKGECWTREKVRGATVHKDGSKISTWLTVSPWLIITCRKVPFKVNFLRRLYFLLVHTRNFCHDR
jgi:hypothetical protein